MGNWVWRKSSFSNGGNNACVEVGQWQKSSHSQGTNYSNCVEVGFAAHVTALRDSKNPDGGSLSLSPTAWANLRSAVTR